MRFRLVEDIQNSPLDVLPDWRREAEEKSLSEGNTYAFAMLLVKLLPDFAEEQNFTFGDAVNRYRTYTDYNDGIFTFYGESNGVPTKYFFDEKMNFVGTKQ